jgi:hypothetical protein
MQSYVYTHETTFANRFLENGYHNKLWKTQFLVVAPLQTKMQEAATFKLVGVATAKIRIDKMIIM